MQICHALFAHLFNAYVSSFASMQIKVKIFFFILCISFNLVSKGQLFDKKRKETCSNSKYWKKWNSTLKEKKNETWDLCPLWIKAYQVSRVISISKDFTQSVTSKKSKTFTLSKEKDCAKKNTVFFRATWENKKAQSRA